MGSVVVVAACVHVWDTLLKGEEQVFEWWFDTDDWHKIFLQLVNLDLDFCHFCFTLDDKSLRSDQPNFKSSLTRLEVVEIDFQWGLGNLNLPQLNADVRLASLDRDKARLELNPFFTFAVSDALDRVNSNL